MVYKVMEIVKELGVSRQAVYKKLKKDEFKQYIVDSNGTIGITEEGLQILKGIKHREIDATTECKPESKLDRDSMISGLQDDLIKNLNKQITLCENQLNIKDKQIEAKDKQIEIKDKQIQELMQITENGQVLQKMILTNTEIKLLAYKEELNQRRVDAKVKEEKKFMNIVKKYFSIGYFKNIRE